MRLAFELLGIVELRIIRFLKLNTVSVCNAYVHSRAQGVAAGNYISTSGSLQLAPPFKNRLLKSASEIALCIYGSNQVR